jgi:hypothetical protein
MRRHGPRTSLICNRESRRSAMARVDRNAFGLWRPLTPESGQGVQAVMVTAKKLVEQFLLEERPDGAFAPLHIPEDNPGQKQAEKTRRLGVTFVEKQKVKTSMGQGGHLWQAVERGRLLSEIEHHQSRQEVALPVPIDGFMWFGRGQRHLVGIIGNGKAKQELVKEAGVIEQLLADVGGKPIHVQIPDHITVAQYGTRRDGLQLSVNQRNEIEMMMQDQFREASVEEVHLGALALCNEEPWKANRP